jgi:ADP-ribose pyrophosphatase
MSAARPGREAAAAPAPDGLAAGDPAGRSAGTVPLTDTRADWRVAGSTELGRSGFLRLRRDQVEMPGGELAGRDVVEHPGAVGVLALDEAERVLLIRQYRHPVASLLWEIPAGLRDVPGESLRATHVLADVLTSPGFSTERVRVFLARGLTEVPAAERTHVPEHEEAQLLLRWVPLAAAAEAVLAGDLHNVIAAVGILSGYAARGGGYAALREADAPEHPLPGS